jgi:hypothetical protein
MATTPDLALLALRVYSTPGAARVVNPDTEKNRPAIPTGWVELEWHPDQGDGFSYGVYRNGTEIVISYAGTNEGIDWASNAVIDGGAGNDVIGDGADSDTIWGGQGNNDTLAGGDGTDKYQFSGNFKRDIFSDSDHSGSIVLGGGTLQGGKTVEGVEEMWRNTEQGYSHPLEGEPRNQSRVISRDGRLNQIWAQGLVNGRCARKAFKANTIKSTTHCSIYLPARWLKDRMRWRGRSVTGRGKVKHEWVSL